MASRNIDVYVKLTGGRNVQYDVDSSSTILSLIYQVAKDEGVDGKQVKLKYQGKVLTTSKTVGQYGVRPETILKSEVLVPKTLALVLQLPGDDVHEITISNLESTKSLFDIVSEKSGVEKHSLLDLECKGQKVKSSSTKLLDAGIENCSEINVKYLDESKESKKTSGAAAHVNDVIDEDEKEAVLSSFQCDGRQVEVVFSFDTTGSMSSYLNQVRLKLRESCTRLIQDIPRLRIGLIAHGDYCDEGNYVLRSVDLTDIVDTLVNFANDVPSTGGGDAPECYEWVLRKAQHLDWSEDSAKALVVIGDYYPHPPSYTDQHIRWRDELDVLKGMGVKVYGVQAGQVGEATNFYAEIADVTEGKHLKLNHFDIITDMFLAVCYREGNEEMLEEFQQELQGAGLMTEQKKEMFEQLKETEEDKTKKKTETSAKSKPKRHVASEWWDHDLGSPGMHPSYTYNEQTDKWSPYRGPATSTSDVPLISLPVTLNRESSTRESAIRRSRRKRCSLM